LNLNSIVRLGGHPKSGEIDLRHPTRGYNPGFAIALICGDRSRTKQDGEVAACALTRGGLSAEHGLLLRESRQGWRASMEPVASARAARLIAAAIALPSLCGCAGLHLDQQPGQVIERTEGEDNYAEKKTAGPVAARVLPYALLAEQSYDPLVYSTHKLAPRASACDAGERSDCDPRDDQRVARWLNEWRYVWSCDGPDQCGVRTSAQDRPSGGLGVQIWARKGATCPEAVIAFRGTVGGDKGDWESNFHWILRAFPIYDQYEQVRDRVSDFIGHIERDKCYRKGETEIIAVGHSLGGGLAQLAAYSNRRIRRVYAFDPSMVTGFYSVDPPNRDSNVKGLRMERVYEFGEILAFGRLFMLHTIPLSPCNPRVVSVRFRVFHGAPIALHSLTDLDNGLIRVARGFQPERSPMALEHCGETPKAPLVAAE
jgi:pimeloyl-ACP methyl ester carboxylesterase